MKIKPHSVQSRLSDWGRWVQEPREHFGRSFSPFGRIAEMQENSGIRGDGIRYEIIDGVACPPDGGHWEEIERRGRAIAHDLKCREVHRAVADLPEQMRRAVIAMFVVPRRESVRTQAEVAERLGITRSTARDALQGAYSRVTRAIYGAWG